MKTRFAAIAVLAVFVVLVSSSVVAFASESDAADVDYSKYYYNQLSTEQKAVYDAYSATITGDPVNIAGAYVYQVSSSASKLDAEKAWEASRLDNPYAFWTWTVGTDAPNIEADGTTITIHMADIYVHASAMASEAKAAIDSIELKGKDEAKRADNINSILSGKSYKFAEDGCGNVSGIIGDDTHTLSAEGFAAVYKALCDRDVNGVKVNCMQVYGTFADGDENKVFAWNTVIVKGQAYATDAASCNKEQSDKWVCAGRYTEMDGDSFAKVHLAFNFNSSAGLGYDFSSELLCNSGYDWPEEDSDIVVILRDNAPWIIIGVICVILAIALVIMARKSD